MKQHREKELKLCLKDRSAYERLIETSDLGEPQRIERQTNHYFDTREFFLVRQGGMLRLREGESLILTFKLGGETRPGGGYFDSLELECEVAPEVLDDVLGDPPSLAKHSAPPAAEVRRRFGILPLIYHGFLHTERRRYLNLAHKLEVDRVRFPDGTEVFEVEIETEDAAGARSWVDALLSKYGVVYEPQSRTKLQLLLEWSGQTPS